MDNHQEAWFLNQDLNSLNQPAESTAMHSNDPVFTNYDGFRGFNSTEYSQQTYSNEFQQCYQEPYSSSRSQSTSPHTFNCEIRRGRPLVQDGEHEPERTIQRRQYARHYRNRIRAEKMKHKDENEKLKDLVQRILLHCTRSQNPMNPTEFQSFYDEFHRICAPTPSQSHVGSFEDNFLHPYQRYA